MTPTAKALLAVLIAAVLLTLWQFRLSVQTASVGFFVLNRWTGTVYFCVGSMPDNCQLQYRQW